MRNVAGIAERSVITKILAHLAKAAAESTTEGAEPGQAARPRGSSASLRPRNAG